MAAEGRVNVDLFLIKQTYIIYSLSLHHYQSINIAAVYNTDNSNYMKVHSASMEKSDVEDCEYAYGTAFSFAYAHVIYE
jgi:hypothetical protein